MKYASDLRKLAKLFPYREAIRLRKKQKRILRNIIDYCTGYASAGKFETIYWSCEPYSSEKKLSVEEAEAIALTLNTMGYLANVIQDTTSSNGDSVGIKISWK